MRMLLLICCLSILYSCAPEEKEPSLDPQKEIAQVQMNLKKMANIRTHELAPKDHAKAIIQLQTVQKQLVNKEYDTIRESLDLFYEYARDAVLEASLVLRVKEIEKKQLMLSTRAERNVSVIMNKDSIWKDEQDGENNENETAPPQTRRPRPPQQSLPPVLQN